VHTIRVPVQSAARFRKVQKVRAMLREELRREPDIAEVAEAANLSERTVTGVSRVETFVFSIHDPIPQSAEREFSEIIPDIAAVTPDAGVADEETMQRMLELVERLPHPQRMILTLRFGLLGERPHTLEEVSNAFGRSRERVRQIQKQALSRLRAMLDEKPVPGPIAVN
jgi:RNA polymerase primary sigma factor